MLAIGMNIPKKLTEGTDYEIKYVDNVSGKDHYGAVLVVAKGKFGGAFEDDDLGIKGGVYTDAEGNRDYEKKSVNKILL